MDIEKLVPVPVGLSAKYDVVKKTVYDKLVEKNKIDTSGFVSRTKYAELKKNSWCK